MKMILLFLLFFLNTSLCVVNTATGDLLNDNIIVVSLQNYNGSTPDGESFDYMHKLLPNSETKIILTKIPADVQFVVLQVHSYLVSVNLSLGNVPLQSNSISGTNVGLLKMYSGADLSFYLTYNSSYEEADIMVSVQAYPQKAPIPGGCNMEFPVEISPFLLTTFDSDTTDVSFAPSSPPLSVFSPTFIIPNSECNMKPSPVRHEMYHRYFPEGDFSKETYFNIMKSLMTKGRILKNANLVKEKLSSPPTKRMFATYPGIGSAFVVMSHFDNFTAIYVPSFTYGCNDLKENNTCLVLTTTFSKVFCATILFVGLFNCFFGHFFFRLEILLFAYLASAIICHILMSNLFVTTIAVTAAVSSVSVALLILVARFWRVLFGLPIVSVIITTSVFGFLLASVIYYPLIDYVDLFVLDINFWGVFVGIVVACPVLMVCLAEKANIISCAFVGSFVGIASIDHYIGSNIRYIFLNTIRRAVSDKFRLALIIPPFQIKDVMLCCAWIILTLLGIAVQKFLMRFRPPYPPPQRPSNYKPSETSPLLSGLF